MATFPVQRKVNFVCLTIQMALNNLIEPIESSFDNAARPNAGEAHLRNKEAQTKSCDMGGYHLWQ